VFDLILTPLHVSAGRVLPELPGFTAIAAPRRADRHRASDLLAVCLSAASGQTLSPELASEAVQILSGAYYRTGGTVTSAVKDAVDALNENLLARSERNPVVLVMNLCVLRGGLVYLAHAGPAHTFLINAAGGSEFFDPSSAGRGLGASRAVPLRFFQASVEAGDALIFSVEPPPTWPVALSLPATRHPARLLTTPTADLRAGLVRVDTGTGQIRSEPLPAPQAVVEAPTTPQPQAAPEMPAPLMQITTPPGAPEETALTESPTPAQSAVPPAQAPGEEFPGLPTTSVVSEARRRVEERRGQHPSSAPAEQPPPKPELSFSSLLRRVPSPARAPSARTPEAAPATPGAPSPVTRKIAAFFRRAHTARVRVGRSVGGVVPRLAPGGQTAFNPSSATLFFIAIAIPIIVVAAATAVYFRSGASEQRIVYLEQARAFTEQASNQQDITQRRANWEQVIYWVNKSEEFGSDEESIALRRKAQVAMDSLDGIVRLQLAPAFTGILADSINVTRMAATNDELYLLDATAGRVLRMTRGARSYEYDPNFSCGPGPYGNMIVGPLVGLATLPPNTASKASVLAIDATGNLLYCFADDSPLSSVLAPPENNWGKITVMALKNGDLFVLDLLNNAVWRYDGDDYTFADRPRLFFGNEVPHMGDVIDLTLYEDDLYLLRSTGQMTVCTYSAFDFSPTRCNDPAPYGGPDGAVQSFSDAGFLQMVTTQPPDPSLFILDTKGPAVYHFSLRLNFQRELRQDPEQGRDFPLPRKPVTAFAISPNRVIFLAFGNQVVFGAIP
jgi:hypothetical protein